MIQVLGLRHYINNAGQTKGSVKFFAHQWRFNTVDDALDEDKVKELLTKVPPHEQYNLCFTVADCFEEQERVLKEQWVIPFDIDYLEFSSEDKVLEEAEHVARVVVKALKVDYANVAVLFSGHGIWVFIKLDSPIVSEDSFVKYRDHYHAYCRAINGELEKAGLKGKADTGAFSRARMSRLPLTENRKPDAVTRVARVIKKDMKPCGFDLGNSDLKFFEKADIIPDATLKNYPKPDTKAVLTECLFLKRNAEHQDKVNEAEWYADLSIRGRLEDGRELCHRASEQHPKYNFNETEIKIDHALASAGPRTCKDINSKLGFLECKNCPHFGKVTSPILIRGPDYISTEGTGFRKVIEAADGKTKLGKPHYEDLIKKFKSEHTYLVIENSDQVYVYKDKYWQAMSRTALNNWVYDRIRPHPDTNEMREFIGRLRATNCRPMNWFYEQSLYKMNFKNVVLDLHTMETELHKPEHGFLSILNFDYDPRAVCPSWDGYMNSWMEGDAGRIELLQAYAGWCLSGDAYWTDKLLIISGSGGNGKSIFVETIQDIAGRGNFSIVPVEQLNKPERRYPLMKALFNFSEEASVKALLDNESLKILSGGGLIEARALFEMSTEFRNRCKFIMSVNNLPYSPDSSDGLYRRLLLVPFNAQFSTLTSSVIPKSIMKENIAKEFAGICNTFLAAYRRAKAAHGFTIPETVVATIEEFKRDSNDVMQFAEECLEVDATNHALKESKTEVYAAYSGWADDRGFRRKDIRIFYKEFKRLYPFTEDLRLGPTGARERFISNVRIIDKEF